MPPGSSQDVPNGILECFFEKPNFLFYKTTKPLKSNLNCSHTWCFQAVFEVDFPNNVSVEK